MSGNPPTSTCPSSSITFGRVFEGTSLFGVFNFVNCNLQHFPIWSKWKLLKSTEESSNLMDLQPINLQRSFAQSTVKATCLTDVIHQQINTWYLGIMFLIINARGRCSPHTVSKSDVCWFLSITHWHIVWNHFCNACIYSICIHQHFCKKFQIELLDQQKGSFRFWGPINYLAWTPILAHCAPPPDTHTSGLGGQNDLITMWNMRFTT